MSEPEVVSAFRQAMREAGIETSEGLVPDGELHRFHVEGDDKGSKNGWYRLHSDHPPAGIFGCWKRGVEVTWCAKKRQELSREERRRWHRRVEAQREEQERAREHRRAKARQEAARLWRDAGPADHDHPYLRRKGILPYGIRQLEDTLIVPVQGPDGALRGLQRIANDGQKRFLAGTEVTGSRHWIGGIPGRTVVVAEGYATAASIHEATGLTVVVAFNAGNLLPISKSVRKDLGPSVRIILAADNDRATEGNPGITKATEAARVVDGLLAVPEFEDGEEGSDFNDLGSVRGLQAVREAIEGAGVVEPLPEASDIAAHLSARRKGPTMPRPPAKPDLAARLHNAVQATDCPMDAVLALREELAKLPRDIDPEAASRAVERALRPRLSGDWAAELAVRFVVDELARSRGR